MQFSPLFALFLSSSLGSYLGIFADLNLVFLIAAASALFFSALIARPIAVRAILVLACCGIFSAGLVTKQKLDASQILAQFPKDTAIYEGIVTDLSQTLEGAVVGTLKVSGVIIEQDRRPLSGNVVFSLYEGASRSDIQVMDRIRIKSRVKPFKPALYPGEFDGRLYALARGLHGRISIQDPMQITTLTRQESTNFFAQARSHLRTRLLELATPREAGVLLALMIGDTRLFDQKQIDLYRRVGAGHLLAVSGLQVSLLALIFFGVGKTLLFFVPGIGRRSRATSLAALFSLILIWGFVALCGSPPSAIRAAAMATTLIVGLILARQVHSIDAFSLCGLATVLIAPASVVDPSFLLSYAAVFGLILAAPKRSEAQKTEDKLLGDEPIARQLRLKSAQALFLTSIAASLLTLPISAHLFGQISLGGFIANIILVPIGSILQVPAIFLGAAAVLFNSPTLASLGASFAGILEALCEGLGQIIGGTHVVTAPPGWMAIILTLFASVFVMGLASKRPWMLAVATSSSVALLLIPMLLEPSGVRMTVLAIGQGDSTVIEFPNKKTMLIDGGGNLFPTQHKAADILQSFLSRRNISTLDYVVISHPHPDHVLGILPVLEQHQIGEIWHSGFDARDPLMARILDIAKRKNIVLKDQRSIFGEHWIGETKIQVLSPHRFQEQFTVNNNSLVLQITHRKNKALWPGDIEKLGEELLLTYQNDLASTIVKAPHHGSKTSSSVPFVQATKPDHVIFCTAEDNQWGFPHKEVVKRWQNAGAKLWNTGTNGEITIWLTENRVQVNGTVSLLIGKQ